MAPKLRAMVQKTSPALQIFRAGKHIAMSGQTIEFSVADLAATCAAYDPAKHEAPLVIGHPSHDLPAYGWVQSIKISNGGMDASPTQVNPAFAEMVKDGAFKKISASFYSPDAPNNPVPGCYYLRHVGFLGAQAPAVKGLRQPSFADDEAGVITFGEYDDATNAGLWRNLREFLIGEFGQEKADRALPNFEVRALELGAQDELRAAAVARAVAPPMTSAFAETQVINPEEQTLTLTPEEIAALQADNARLQTTLAANLAAQTHAAHVAFCESIPVNRLTPAMRPVALALMDSLTAGPAVVEFGEGEAKKPLLDAFKTFLQALPEVVAFGELATNERAAAGPSGAGVVNFAAPQGYSVDSAKLAELGRAKAYQAAHKVDLVTAVNAVRAGQA